MFHSARHETAQLYDLFWQAPCLCERQSTESRHCRYLELALRIRVARSNKVAVGVNTKEWQFHLDSLVATFISVGKLIRQVTVELRENGVAATEYQYLLIELEALQRALEKLDNLKPTKHELIQLTSIQATALAYRKPLQDFLNKMSKFESSMGLYNANGNKWRGLPRRLQFKAVFKDDIKQLRSALMSHVATINLLLITQAMASISIAEEERDRFACNLESKILGHRQLLMDIKNQVDTSLKNQRGMKVQFNTHSSTLDNLGHKADQTCQKLTSQEVTMQDIHRIATRTEARTKSILAGGHANSQKKTNSRIDNPVDNGNIPLYRQTRRRVYDMGNKEAIWMCCNCGGMNYHPLHANCSHCFDHFPHACGIP